MILRGNQIFLGMTSALWLCEILCNFSERHSGIHGVNTSAQEKGKQDDINESESG